MTVRERVERMVAGGATPSEVYNVVKGIAECDRGATPDLHGAVLPAVALAVALSAPTRTEQARMIGEVCPGSSQDARAFLIRMITSDPVDQAILIRESTLRHSWPSLICKVTPDPAARDELAGLIPLHGELDWLMGHLHDRDPLNLELPDETEGVAQPA